MTAKPTGRLAQREDGLYIMFDRLFNEPIEKVWASLSRPAELEKWIGTYTGSPTTGAVRFRMTAEAEAEWEYVNIRECVAPHRFTGDFGTGPKAWHALFHLVEGDGMTTLTFGQRLHTAAEAATVGPGWDYYLDRLVAVRAGRALPEWSHYSTAHSDFYRGLFVPAPAV
ncbi:hypothetical protein E3T55_10445 [Cryobacterium frigoriphilum]|uniref:Activator of Hsp90 ATPase homologue 1/2-like C-terminal domain-containing protein n=1 Tax=Cryobacterium frigoriphilum TaxID=1259150 RepID=A0A4R9A0A4_9MICO|nr:SRPBCC domain-containing protein [Cryobacterium frigoriphilum]TFD49840.1 hypothetical protein E3T55_10445 [Cryobacterium frigoriphilum]